MKAMILAAGEGRRMHPLTLARPKPLLEVAGASLIAHQIRRLSLHGFTDLVINVAYLGDQIIDALGDGRHLGVRIRFSRESTPLETGGGLLQALPLLGDDPFLLINSDIWTEYPLAELRGALAAGDLAHLVLVDNPEHNPEGDFSLAVGTPGRADRVVTGDGSRLTFSGLSVLDPGLIRDYPERRAVFPLGETLRWAMAQGRVSGVYSPGPWMDIGTPDRLRQLDAWLALPGHRH